MKNTTNYGLNKPETTDYYNVEHQNENMEILDGKLKEVEDYASDAKADVDAHVTDKENPHGVTKEQLGLDKVQNVSTNDQTPTYEVVEELAELTNGEKLSSAFGKIAKVVSSVIGHVTNVGNPHNVTKTQVGLSNVPNVATNNQTPTYEVASNIAELSSGEKLSTAFSKIAKAISSLIGHLANVSNPHGVTKAQIGLGNVDNTSDANKPISNATQTALNTLSNEIETVKKSASDGKSAIASAITAQGVPTNADATYSTMAVSIGTVGTNKYNAGKLDGNTADKTALYQALQYSGLVTVDMTYAEMCEALATAYPQYFALYKDGVNKANFVSYAGSAGGGAYANTDAGYANLAITFGENINAVYSNMNGSTHVSSIMSKLVDLTSYKKLKFNFSATGSNEDTAIRDISVFITDTLKTDMVATAKYNILSANTQTSNSGEGVIDISNLSGNYYIGINLIARRNVNLTIGNMILDV